MDIPVSSREFERFYGIGGMVIGKTVYGAVGL
jgi:hypothetical protein